MHLSFEQETFHITSARLETAVKNSTPRDATPFHPTRWMGNQRESRSRSQSRARCTQNSRNHWNSIPNSEIPAHLWQKSDSICIRAGQSETHHARLLELNQCPPCEAPTSHGA